MRTRCAMFGEVYDAISFLFSWRWPEAMGEVTAVEVEEIQQLESNPSFRLAVAYKFWVGADGPYIGESYWEPAFFSKKRVAEAAANKIQVGQPVKVRYRRDDPSVNKLDRLVWQEL